MAAIVAGGTDVDADKNGELTFLGKLFHIGVSKACRDIPVDRANFVSGLIFPEIIKVDPFPFEATVVFAAEAFANQPPGPQLDLTNLLKNV